MNDRAQPTPKNPPSRPRTLPRLDPSRVPASLVAAHAAGLPLVLKGRFSGEYGQNAYGKAANDLHEAAAYLASLGIDLFDVLPSRAELIELLSQTPTIQSRQANGKTFVNRFLRLDYRATHGVIVVVSAGTGRKLDENASQPFVAYVAELIRTTGAIALLANRIDRTTRRAWALGPIMTQLAVSGGFIGDARHGFRSAEGVDSILVFFSAQAGEEEAAKLPAQTRRGMRDATGTSLANGSCNWGVATLPPPGLFTYRSRQNGLIGPRILTFDTPMCRPEAANVAAGLPEVFHEDGTPVDQVASVRWLLKHAGLPGWTTRRLAERLAQRRFSTEPLRRANTLSKTFDKNVAATAPHRIVNTVLRHLDTYESGEWTIGLGVEGFESITISDVMPPDGEPWASCEDFARIRAWKDASRQAKARGVSFAGLDVLVDDQECILITRTPDRRIPGTEHGLRTALRSEYRERRRYKAPREVVLLPANLLTNTLADALLQAGDSALALVQADDGDDIEALGLLELREARTRLRVLEDERSTIEQQLLASHANGDRVLTGPLLEWTNERYNQVVSVDIPAALAAIDRIDADVSEQRRQRRDEHRGAAVGSLLELLSSLRDPFDNTHDDLLRRGVRNLEIRTTRHRNCNRSWIDYDIRFDFHIDDGERMLILPVRTSYTHRKVFDLTVFAQEALDHLRAAPSTWAVAAPLEPGKTAKELARLLEIPPRCLMLPNVSDPRLAQLVALVLSTESLDDVATLTGEPRDLLERIRRIHRGSTRAVWRTHPSKIRALWYHHGQDGQPVGPNQLVPAAADSWENARASLYRDVNRQQWALTGRGRYILQPCPHCGSRRRLPMLIPEPDGLLCLDCRRDSSAFVWPADAYDRYLELPDCEEREA